MQSPCQRTKKSSVHALKTGVLGTAVFRLKLFPVILLLAFLVGPTLAQSADQSADCRLSLNLDYVKKYYFDTKNICLAPLAWNKTNWLTVALVTGTTVGLYAVDEKIKDWAQAHRNRTSDDIAVAVKPFGDGRYSLPPLALFYLYGHFAKNHKACHTALVGLESFLVSNIFIQTLKFACHRHRPHTSDPFDTWDGPSLRVRDLSFPSGHSNAAFSIATSIAYGYQDKPLVPAVCYSIAALTAVSRVNDNDHWAADVFFGSAVGFFTARAIGKLSQCPSAKTISLEPAQNKLALVYLF